jgi:hypothetical protein
MQFDAYAARRDSRVNARESKAMSTTTTEAD